MFYVQINLKGTRFKVCNEITNEVIAIFFNRNEAIKYAYNKNVQSVSQD